MRRLRIAFVVQRYGLEVNGGAEALCRTLAERLARNHEVEVLTTRAIDYVTWRDEYPAGDVDINGVRVRRFGVDSPRQTLLFDEMSRHILELPHTEEDEIQWMKLQGPYSTDLLEYLERNRTAYDAFLFMTYLYGTTYFGLPIVADRALLVPTAHDEWPIYLGIFDKIFHQTRHLICNTPEELAFLRRRFFSSELNGEVVGVGFDPVPEPQPDPEWNALRGCIGDSPFVLYLGRIDESKGCGMLFDYFQRYHSEFPESKVKLVLLGKPVMAVPDHPKLITGGFVSESTKLHTICASRFMITPSPYESLCFAAIEAWLMRKPVLANGNCSVLRGQCIRSNGGLWYADYWEFREGMNRLLADDALVRELGEQGHDFAVQNYTWEEVDRRLARILALIAPAEPSRSLAAVAVA